MRSILVLLAFVAPTACDQLGAPEDGDGAPAEQVAALVRPTVSRPVTKTGALADRYQVGISCPDTTDLSPAYNENVTDVERQCCSDAGCSMTRELVATEEAGICWKYYCDCGFGSVGGTVASADDNAYDQCINAHR